MMSPGNSSSREQVRHRRPRPPDPRSIPPSAARPASIRRTAKISSALSTSRASCWPIRRFSIRYPFARCGRAMRRWSNTGSSATPDFFDWCDANWQGVFAGGPARDEAVAAQLPRQGRRGGARRARGRRPRAAQSRPHLRPCAGTHHAYDSTRLVHGEGVAIGLCLAFRFSPSSACARPRQERAGRTAPRDRWASRPVCRTYPADTATVDDIARRHGAGQEGQRGRADLHPRAGDRAELRGAPGIAADKVRAFLDERNRPERAMTELPAWWRSGPRDRNRRPVRCSSRRSSPPERPPSPSRHAPDAHPRKTPATRAANRVPTCCGCASASSAPMLIGNNIVSIGVAAFATWVLTEIIGAVGAIYAMPS